MGVTNEDGVLVWRPDLSVLGVGKAAQVWREGREHETLRDNS